MNHFNKLSFCYKSTLQDALLWYTYDAVHIISTTAIAKRKNYCDDRGAFPIFQELMHSWVGYKLVKVLLILGLSPKICNDLENWSPDLFHLFSYMGDKQGDTKKKKKLIGSYLFSSIKLYTAGVLQNCHLDARTNLKKCPILYYHLLY